MRFWICRFGTLWYSVAEHEKISPAAPGRGSLIKEKKSVRDLILSINPVRGLCFAQAQTALAKRRLPVPGRRLGETVLGQTYPMAFLLF